MKNKNKSGRVIQRERRVYHGNYLTVHIFPVFQKATSRGKKTKVSKDVQVKLNQKYREERITYLINNNFDENDIEIGLGFDDDYLPENYEDAKKIIRNYIRRLKRYYKKNNITELKYIYVIEKGERSGRWHYHMIMSGGVDRNILEEMWGMGYAHTYRLVFDEQGLKGLAHYKVKEPETAAAVIDGKVRRWCSSKNLKQPYVPKDRDGFISKRATREIREGYISDKEIERLYPGYSVSSVEPFFNNNNAGEYLTIRLYTQNPKQKLKRKRE